MTFGDGLMLGILVGCFTGVLLGTHWGIRHAETSIELADFWQEQFVRVLEAYSKLAAATERASHPEKQP